MPLLLFAVVVLLIAASVAIPAFAYGDRKISDANAFVLAGALLAGSLGLLNFGFLAAYVIGGEIPPVSLLIGLMPIASALVGFTVVALRLRNGRRLGMLLLAALLALAGIPAYFALTFAIFVAVVAAGTYLIGLVDVRTFIKSLDPRN